MPRFVVQRTFSDGFLLETNPDDPIFETLAANNSEQGVHWVSSFVSADRRETFCTYDGPSPEAIRRAAKANGLPVDRITEVRVLDPAFYTSPKAEGVRED